MTGRLKRGWLGNAIAVATTALLAACGGGGSSGEAAPPAVDREAPLALTAANAGDATGEAFSLAAQTLGLGQLAVDWANALQGNGNGSVNLECGSGTGTATLVDRDGNGKVGPGDRITVQVGNCPLRALGASYSGNASIELTASTDAEVTWAGTITLGAEFGYRDAGVDYRTEGTLHFEFRSTRLSKSLRLSSAPAPLTFTANDGRNTVRELLTGVNTRREVRRDSARTSTMINVRVASEALGGSFQASTPTTWSSWFGNFPDAGVLQLSGASGSTTSTSANSQGDNRLELRLGGTQIGEMTLLDAGSGYLWSGTGWVAPPSPSLGYGTVAASSQTGVLQAFAAPAEAAVAPGPAALVWAYSRPLASSLVLSGSFTRTDMNDPERWAATSIPVQVQIEGALLSITPTSQLEPGASYRLDLQSSAANGVVAENGGSLPLPGFSTTVISSIRARASIGAPGLLLGPGQQLALDASASSAVGGAVARVQWRQISGPALTFDSTSGTVVHVTSTGSSSGVAKIELEVANAAGEIDRQSLEMRVVGEPATTLLLQVRQGNTAPTIYTGIDFPGTTSTVRYYAQSGALDVMLTLGAGGGIHRFLSTAAGVGSYSFPGQATAVWQTTGNTACSGSQSGTISVFEYAADGQGLMSQLALDFDVLCPDGTTTLGSVRYNSSRPLRP